MGRLWPVSDKAMEEFSKCVTVTYAPDKKRVLETLRYILNLPDRSEEVETVETEQRSRPGGRNRQDREAG